MYWGSLWVVPSTTPTSPPSPPICAHGRGFRMKVNGLTLAPSPSRRLPSQLVLFRCSFLQYVQYWCVSPVLDAMCPGQRLVGQGWGGGGGEFAFPPTLCVTKYNQNPNPPQYYTLALWGVQPDATYLGPRMVGQVGRVEGGPLPPPLYGFTQFVGHAHELNRGGYVSPAQVK